MDKEFWLERWKEQQIGFHEGVVNELLEKHCGVLSLQQGNRIFVPLCGKTVDIHWLLSKGYSVVGIELSELAVQQLFGDLQVTPNIVESSDLKLYQTDGLDVYVGDIFSLSAERLGSVDAVYDRAALVALPFELRQRYTQHLKRMTHHAQQLLISFEYDQETMAGPPFSISPEEISEHYKEYNQIHCLEKQEVSGKLKGLVSAVESVWFLI